MADYSAARIWIGGRISKRLIRPLCEAITQEQLFVPTQDKPFAPRSEQALMVARQRVCGEYVLQLEDEAVPFGEFPALEAFLIENRIAFDRRTSRHHDYDASVVYYRPESGREVWPVDELGAPLIEAAPVLEGLSILRRARDESPRYAQLVMKIYERMEQIYPELPSQLTELYFAAPPKQQRRRLK